MRILLVDDEPLLLKSYARYLRRGSGHEVLCANGGREALAALEAEDPIDMIFCDLAMSDIDGVSVHRAVCDQHPELASRFVFLTGGTTDEATDRYVAESGALVLIKPVRQTAFDKILADAGGG